MEMGRELSKVTHLDSDFGREGGLPGSFPQPVDLTWSISNLIY